MNAPAAGRWQRLDVEGRQVEARVVDPSGPAPRRLWPSVGEYPVYDEFLYYVMLQDQPRNVLFERAVAEQASGRVVVELGTGPDLLWSTVAAANGARRVVAVEELEESARSARQRAKALGRHVQVVHGAATHVTLPVRANLCIAELVGAIGGAEGIADAVADAWRRHLEPGAAVVPHRVRSRFAAVCAADLLDGPPGFHPEIVPYVEAVFRAVGSVFDLRTCLTGLTPDDLLTTTDILEDLDLGANTQTHAKRISVEVVKPGTIDSGLLWLELQCAPGQEVLDSLATVTNWMPVLLPFSLSRPIPVRPGDRLQLDVHRTVPDGLHPEWSFTGAVRFRDGSSIPVRAESPYAGGPFRSTWLHRALFRPATAEDHRG